jgi:ceramide glucosyltransferase
VTIAGVALLLLAVTGLLCCTGFLVLILVAVSRFRRRPELPASPQLPPVSLLKPLCGLEPGLEANLASFFEQNYPEFEIVFGTRNAEDPALEIARAVQQRFPRIPVKYVYSGEPDRANAKVCSLEKMVAAATHDFLVISDSDVHVTPVYIEEVTRPLLNPQVGLVSCLYRGVPTGGIWSRLEALGMSVEMTSGVIVAEMLEGMKFALGPTMATRRDVLDTIGGIGVLADYCADDFVLGQKVSEAGMTVVMSSHVIDHVVLNRSFADSMLHQTRWMKSTRFSRPKGHVGTVLTFAMPFGLLAMLGALLAGHWVLAVCLFAYAVLNRLTMCIATGWGVVRDRLSLRDCWLYPVRDLMGFGFWAASFMGSTIVWRQKRFRLGPGGLMFPVETANSKQSPVTVELL